VTDFGGMGGIEGGRPRDPEDLFEAAVDRAMGDRLRAEGIKGAFIAPRLWGSLSNVDWIHENGDTASYSFRAAGDLIAALIGEGDYMDWYCSGHDGLADEEVAELMAKEGWRPFHEEARL
jgi:hypothetical protein